MAKSDLPLSSSFVAEFCQRLSRQSPVLHLARSWLEQRLARTRVVHRTACPSGESESGGRPGFRQPQHCQSSFPERHGLEGVRGDPEPGRGRLCAPILPMFTARWILRPAIAIAIRSKSSPGTASSRKRTSRSSAIQLAADSARQKGREDRTAHVGFYLIDKGQSMLGRMANVRWPWRTIIERSIHRFPLTFYAGGIGVLTLLATFGFVQQAQALEVQGWKLIFFTLVFLLCASQLAVALMNWLSTLLVKPRLLPRLDYSSGIAPDCRTMVVVPTMLTSLEGVDRLIETLEIHHLANRDPHLHFALLTDFRDAPEEILPGDRGAAAAGAGRSRDAQPQVSRPTAQDLFFLFHRPRRWNAGEGLWMGYERKRGKLMEFNALLRGGSQRLLFRDRRGDRPFCRPSSMSSRSTPTPSFRAMPPVSSSERWPIR